MCIQEEETFYNKLKQFRALVATNIQNIIKVRTYKSSSRRCFFDLHLRFNKNYCILTKTLLCTIA